MDIQIKDLEKHWPDYVKWCHGQGLYPDFSDYLVWLDDYDIDAGQNEI